MTMPGRRLLRLLPLYHPLRSSRLPVPEGKKKHEGCRGDALPRAPIKRRSPLRHVAIRTSAVLTGTVVPGKACREASCRKSPGCEAPRFTARKLERGGNFGRASPLQGSTCHPGFVSPMPSPFHPPPPSLFSWARIPTW